MLFSNEQVATYVNQNFEPAWDMVRPVPIIRIDFGNGRVATRTLHGNIATHVCGADGMVTDILPGMYTPPVFTTALAELHRATVALGQTPDRLTAWRGYHRVKAQRIRNLAASPQAVIAQVPPQRRLDVGKGRVEMRVERLVLQPALNMPPNGVPRPRADAPLAQWNALAIDTARNETERRLQVHDHLARGNAVRPEQIKFWLYKHVLHADLNDPYLGLGDAVLGDDIFRDFE